MRFNLIVLLVSLSLIPFIVNGEPPGPMSEEDRARFDRMGTTIPDVNIADGPGEDLEAIRDTGLKPFEKSSSLQKEAGSFETAQVRTGNRILARRQALIGNEELMSMSDMRPQKVVPLAENIVDTSMPERQEGEDVVTVDCEGGMYFNELLNLGVLQKDVVVKSYRGALKCNGQLKFILKREEKPGEERQAPVPGKIRTPEFDNMDFSGVEYLYASGGVILKRFNKRGVMEAIQGRELIYDGRTGEILLFGEGKKMILSGDNRIETESEGSYMRMYGNGSIYVHGDTVTRLDAQINQGDKKGKKTKKKKVIVEPQWVEDFDLGQKKPDKELTVLHAKGYAYFDIDRKEVIYERDINIQGPDYWLRSDNQLKMGLIIKKKPGAGEKKKDREEIKLPDYESLQFEGVKYAVTSGNVVFQRVSEAGVAQGAKGSQVTYNGVSGDILLDGPGKKLLMQGEDFQEISGAGSYVKFFGNGSYQARGKGRGLMHAKEREDGKKTFSIQGAK